MAEAVGLAASIVQIVSTGVQVSVYLYNFTETVSSAGKALKEVSDDITFTTSVLEQLRVVLASEKHNGVANKQALSTAEVLVKKCSDVFEAIMALVKKHFPDLEPGHRRRAKLNTLKWPFIQPKIEALRSDLEKHKTKLILMTQVLTYAKIAASEQRNVEDQLELEWQKLAALVIVSYRTKAQKTLNVNLYGLTEVFSPGAKASVDLVFVHGIFGHPKHTWTCDDEDVFWPAELLPPILEDEGTRILTYGYEAGPDAFADGEPRHKIHEAIGSLSRDLVSNRQIRKATERPLVFVAHSLGGLIVKGVLAHSFKDEAGTIPNLKSISISTYGVIFLSTPHHISPLHIDLICEAAVRKELCKVTRNIEQLKARHTALQLVNQEFLDLANHYQLYCFREMLEPKVLDDFSARLSMLHTEATCIHTDHYMISKFGSENSPGFDQVCAVIQNYASRAPLHISSRWQAERTRMKVQARIVASEQQQCKIFVPIPIAQGMTEPRILFHHWRPQEHPIARADMPMLLAEPSKISNMYGLDEDRVVLPDGFNLGQKYSPPGSPGFKLLKGKSPVPDFELSGLAKQNIVQPVEYTEQFKLQKQVLPSVLDSSAAVRKRTKFALRRVRVEKSSDDTSERNSKRPARESQPLGLNEEEQLLLKLVDVEKQIWMPQSVQNTVLTDLPTQGSESSNGLDSTIHQNTRTFPIEHDPIPVPIKSSMMPFTSPPIMYNEYNGLAPSRQLQPAFKQYSQSQAAENEKVGIKRPVIPEHSLSYSAHTPYTCTPYTYQYSRSSSETKRERFPEQDMVQIHGRQKPTSSSQLNMIDHKECPTSSVGVTASSNQGRPLAQRVWPPPPPSELASPFRFSARNGYASFYGRTSQQESDPGSNDVDKGDHIISCICGLKDDDGHTILCDVCRMWQHVVCYYHDNHIPGADDDHFCVDCNPDQQLKTNLKTIREHQTERRELPAKELNLVSHQKRVKPSKPVEFRQIDILRCIPPSVSLPLHDTVQERGKAEAHMALDLPAPAQADMPLNERSTDDKNHFRLNKPTRGSIRRKAPPPPPKVFSESEFGITEFEENNEHPRNRDSRLATEYKNCAINLEKSLNLTAGSSSIRTEAEIDDDRLVDEDTRLILGPTLPDAREPTSINAKQRERIIKRRLARKKLGEALNSTGRHRNQLVPLPYRSLRRSRGPSGRFLTSNELMPKDLEESVAKDTEDITSMKSSSEVLYGAYASVHRAASQNPSSPLLEYQSHMYEAPPMRRRLSPKMTASNSSLPEDQNSPLHCMQAFGLSNNNKYNDIHTPEEDEEQQQQQQEDMVYTQGTQFCDMERVKPSKLYPGLELYDLQATEDEKIRAEKEVMKLLAQWTTVDTSQWTNASTQVVDMEIDVIG